MRSKFLFFAVQLSVLSLSQLVPLNKKPWLQQNSIVVTAPEQDGQDTKNIRSQIRNSIQSIADFAVNVNGSDLILQKDTPDETIIISTKIPSIAQKTPIDPEDQICDKEGSFNVELKRGQESLFTFLCLTNAFFDEKASFAMTRIRPDQPLRRSSFDDLSNIFTRFNVLSDDRVRKILKDKDITPDLVEIMQNVANRYRQ